MSAKDACANCGSQHIYYGQTECASCGWHAPGQTTLHADFARDDTCQWCNPNYRDARVRLSASEVYTPEGVDIWMGNANGLLGGEIPAELIKTDDGLARVLGLLEGLKDGVVF